VKLLITIQTFERRVLDVTDVQKIVARSTNLPLV